MLIHLLPNPLGLHVPYAAILSQTRLRAFNTLPILYFAFNHLLSNDLFYGLQVN